MQIIFQKAFTKSLDKTGEEMQKLSVKYGYDFVPITIEAFSHKVVEDIEFDTSRKDWFAYGSSAMVDVVREHGLKPGVFDCIANERIVAEKYGEQYLNHDLMHTNRKTIFDDIAEFNEYAFFVKPVDRKYFPGTIVDKDSLRFVLISQIFPDTTPSDYDIIVSPVKMIEKEWRLFYVDGEFVTGSQYHAAMMRLEINPNVPEYVIGYADSVVHGIWMPSDNFVIDVALMKDGEMKVVEVNELNYSGLYASNVNDLLIAVDQYLNK